MNKEVGKITHWYDKISVAVIKLSSSLSKGDVVTITHGEDEFQETISSMQIDHKDVEKAKKGDEAAVQLSHKAKEGSTVSVEN